MNIIDQPTNTMDQLIKFVSYNCKNIKGDSKEHVKELCKDMHVIALQETWLYPHDIECPIVSIDHFRSYSQSAIDVHSEILRGRPHGGLSFLWNTKVLTDVVVKDFKLKRILGLSVKINGRSILILNVYFPSGPENNLEEYLACMGELAGILEEKEEADVCILGDFNASPTSRVFADLTAMLQDYNISFQDTVHLPGNTATHWNAAHNTTSWIDHIALSPELTRCLGHCFTVEDFSFSDHCPIGCEVLARDFREMAPVHRAQRRINWKFEDHQKRTRFYQILDNELSNLPLAIIRRATESNRVLDSFLEFINDSIIKSGKRAYGMKKKNEHNIPGWNEHVRELHNEARAAYRHWKVANKPRVGNLVEEMKRARMRFKLALKNVRQNELLHKNEAMLRKLQSGQSKNFWRDIKSLSPNKDSLPVMVQGRTGEANIAEMWRDHFSEIANSVPNDDNREIVQDSLQDVLHVPTRVTVAQLGSLGKQLKCDKAIGNDGVPAEVFKYASPRLLTTLSIFLSACLSKAYLPGPLMDVLINPLLKSKSKDSSDKNNYRPIAIATAISKLVELILMEKLHEHLDTTDYQFGFKAQHGTELAIFTMKQTISYYNNRNSPVYLCFLDAKKAFDRVNHWTLFRKLLDRGAPKHLVKILLHWYQRQEHYVTWGHVKSDSYRCTNGIRQGGLLSPLLYNIYIDELNDRLAQAGVGCSIGGQNINVLSYADDMVIMAPTVTALQVLLDICVDFANGHDIVYNTSKTVCMLLKPRRSNATFVTDINLGGTALQYVEEFKYLGHIISEDCRDEKDVHKQFRRQNAVGNMLIKKFNFASKDIKIQLFKSYCYPIYCNSLWGKAYAYALRRLNVSYNDTFRRLMQVPRNTTASQVFAENHTDHLKVVFRKNAYSMMTRVQNSPNMLVQTVLQCDDFYHSAIARRWRNLLLTVDN